MDIFEASSSLFPKRTIGVLAVLLASHYFLNGVSSSPSQQEEDSLRYAQEELVKRREKVELWLSKDLSQVEDISSLLEALEDLGLALEVSNQDIWMNPLIDQGYNRVSQGISNFLALSYTEDASEILNGPLVVLEKQLHEAPSKFVQDKRTQYWTQVQNARKRSSQKRLNQLFKAGVVLKRAIPEMCMISISSILSLYAGSLDSARLYWRGEVLTRAISGKPQSVSQLYQLVGLEILIVLVSILKERSQSIGKRRFIQHLKSDLFASLVKQDIAYFEKHDLWKVRHTIGTCDFVCSTLLNSPTNHLEAFARISTSLLLLFRQSPSLATFIFLFALPCKQVLDFWLEKLGNRKARSLVLPPPPLNDVWQTLIDPKALKTMRAFAREPVEIKEFSRSIHAIDVKETQEALVFQLITPCRDALDKVLEVVGVWVGGRLVGMNQMRGADLPAFVNICTNTFQQAQFLYYSLGAFENDVLEPIEEMHDLLLSVPSIGIDLPKYDANLSLDFSLEFRNVRFKYETAEILRGISFTVKNGERVGIMGDSGCGKSTLFNLVERFYEPTSGEILLGGIPLGKINPLFLRERIALVSQQSYMAKRTIKENLLYGRRDGQPCSDEEIAAILEQCQCSFFLQDKMRFPDGLLTNIGVNASRLSGGEVQRLSLARSLLSLPPPSLFLLDEYTSALDETTQGNIVEAIQKIWEQRKFTLLCIAHRLSNFKNVDRVIVLSKEGTVEEDGPPQQLMKIENGHFARYVHTSQVNF